MKMPIAVALAFSCAVAHAQTGPDSWSASDYLPVAAGKCGVVATNDPDVLIVSMPALYSYTISSRSFRQLAASPSRSIITYMESTRCVYALTGSWTTGRYSADQDRWEEGVTGLSQDPHGAGNTPIAMVAAGTKVYALGVPYSSTEPIRNRFFVMDPAARSPINESMTGDWSELAPAPVNSYPGAAMVWDGGNFIYAVSGGTITQRYDFVTQQFIFTDTSSPKFHRYSISGGTWAPLEDAPETSTDGDALAIDRDAGVIYFKSTHVNRYAIGTGGVVVDDPWSQDPIVLGADAGGMACSADGGTLFIAGLKQLRRYSTSASDWIPPSDDAIATPEAGMLIAAGGDGSGLYVLAEGFGGTFRRYDCSTGTWSDPLAPPPSGRIFSYLVSTGDGYIYALMNTYMARYSIAENAWELAGGDGSALRPPPPVVIGGATRGPGGSIFVTVPADGTNPRGLLYSHSPAVGWTKLPATPDHLAVSGSLAIAWDGDDRLYTFGKSKVSEYNWPAALITYTISNGAWNETATGPLPMEPGACLIHAGFRRTLYAIGGTLSKPDAGRRFWSYDMAGDGWTELAMAPFWNGRSNMFAYPGVGDMLYAVPGGIKAMFRYRAANTAPALAAPALTTVDGSSPANLRADLLFSATAADAEGDASAIEVEVKADGGFDDITPVPGVRTPLAAGASTRTLRIAAAAFSFATSYQWRVRTADALGGMSAWAVQPAFTTVMQSAPDVAWSGQFDRHGRAVPAGAGLFDTAILRAACDDAQGDSFRIHVEVRPAGESFRGVETGASGLVPSGEAAEHKIRLEPGAYVWQFMAEDQFGNASPWMRAGTGDIDFTVSADGSTAATLNCHGSAGADGSLLLPLIAAFMRRRSLR